MLQWWTVHPKVIDLNNNWNVQIQRTWNNLNLWRYSNSLGLIFFGHPRFFRSKAEFIPIIVDGNGFEMNHQSLQNNLWLINDRKSAKNLHFRLTHLQCQELISSLCHNLWCLVLEQIFFWRYSHATSFRNFLRCNELCRIYSTKLRHSPKRKPRVMR